MLSTYGTSQQSCNDCKTDLSEVIPSKEKAIHNVAKLMLEFLWEAKQPKIIYYQFS